MKKEELLALGLSEEHAEKVAAEFKKAVDNNFVPKFRFNEINEKLQRVESGIKERDEQLETLKNSKGLLETLKKQIEELQTSNKAKETQHAAELTKLKRDAYTEGLLRDAKAKNVDVAKAYLNALPPVSESATIEEFQALRKQQVVELSSAESTKFLFSEQGGGPVFAGLKPGESANASAEGGVRASPKPGTINNARIIK